MISYRLLMLLLWPALVIYTLRLSRRYQSSRYFKQRLGYAYPKTETQPVWIHCASVGEVNTLRPLLLKLIQQFPNTQWLITTNTVTGANTIEKLELKNVQHCFLPLDTAGAVQRFFRDLRPRLALIMETELWPLLYQQCKQRNIPLCIVNGRLSGKTLHAGNWIKSRYHDTLQCVDYIYARSEEDAAGFVQLGMDKAGVNQLGNLKFDQHFEGVLDDVAELSDIKYVLAASTHHDEEQTLAHAWQHIDTKNHLLVIAPRHPERAQDILRQLKILNLRVAQRSCEERIEEDTDVYLADTLGELRRFMKNASLVFMGGSLIPRGGQNLLEPAALGKAIMVGPHMDNFAEETRLLLQHRACVQLNSVNQLSSMLEKLLIDEGQREQLGAHAAHVMEQQSVIADSYLRELTQRYSTQLG
mgnify:FL=1